MTQISQVRPPYFIKFLLLVTTSPFTFAPNPLLIEKFSFISNLVLRNFVYLIGSEHSILFLLLTVTSVEFLVYDKREEAGASNL